MLDLLLRIKDYILSFVSRYSFFINGSYYSSLFSKYFSVAGFIVGFCFVLLVYFSSAETQKKAGFFKVLPIIAVINSCNMLISFFSGGSIELGYSNGMESLFNAPDNIISGFITTLVIVSCYKEYHGRAFLLGVAIFAAVPMLYFAYFPYLSTEEIVFVVFRTFLAGFLCLIISYRKCFYTSWIWYFGFHVLIRVGRFFTPALAALVNGNQYEAAQISLPIFISYCSEFKLDLIVFVVILMFGIVFEKTVVRPKISKATA